MCYLSASKLGNQIHIHHRKVSSPNDVTHMTEQRRKHAPHLCTTIALLQIVVISLIMAHLTSSLYRGPRKL